MTTLIQERCVACRADSPRVTEAEIAAFQPSIPDWKLYDDGGIKKLARVFKVPDFAKALELTAAVGAEAELEGHHPMITAEWGRVTVTWWTHKIKGLHRNDFIMAAKTDRISSELIPAN
ncbi:MAG: 4a-hydroxytetrahydrobiopterin dehydratase [Chloroflexi bacterium]|nr:4a-hydroxytetrahydrobiopterin dehydratase [Chloroflexota bacterium]